MILWTASSRRCKWQLCVLTLWLLFNDLLKSDFALSTKDADSISGQQQKCHPCHPQMIPPQYGPIKRTSTVPVKDVPVQPIAWPPALLLAAFTGTAHPNDFTLCGCIAEDPKKCSVECDVDRMNSYRGNRRTDRQTDTPSILVICQNLLRRHTLPPS